jgi:hypothetical protein
MISRKKKVLLAFLLIVFGLALGSVLGEVLIRMIAPPWLTEQMKEMNLARNAAVFGSDVGWSVETIDGRFVRFVPNTHFDVHHYEYNHSVHIDSWGGRINSASKTSGELIPFLGDSFGFGIGVGDNETFVNLFSAHSPYHVVNLSVPGSALPNQLDQIEFRHKELHSPPVYVFSFFAGNDYADIFRYYSKIPQGKGKETGAFIQWLDRKIFRNRILGKSYLLQFLKHTIFKQQFYTDRRTETLPESCAIRMNGKQMTSSALCIMAAKKKCINDLGARVKMAVERLDELSRKLRFVPIFIIIPDKAQVNPALLATKATRWGLDVNNLKTEMPNTIIERELMTYGIRYIDLTECLNGRPEFYYRVDDHFTPAGHRAVANYLSNRLNLTIAAALNAPK